MPNIKEYDAGNLGLQPTEVGIESTAAAARRIGADYHQIGRELGQAVREAGDVAVDYLAHREISAGAKSYAQMFDNLSNSWNETVKNADPNDPTVATKFRDQVLEPALDQYRQGFLTEKGQNFAETRIDHLRTSMFHQTAADMSSMARRAVGQNTQELEIRFSNSAYRNPELTDQALEGYKSGLSAVADSSPTLKPADRERVMTEHAEKASRTIVLAGAAGAVRKSADPEAEAQKWAEKYPQYISGVDAEKLGREARQVNREDRAWFSWQQTEQKRQRAEISDNRENEVLQDIYSDKPKLDRRAISTDDKLTPNAKMRMIGIVERETKPEAAARVSAGNYIKTLDDIRKGKITDRGEITDRMIAGQFNRTDYQAALKDFDEMKDATGDSMAKDRAEFFKKFAPTIDSSVAENGMHSALGMQKMYEAEKEARRQENDLRKQGKDPHSLYDPTSPDYFGRPGMVAKFHVSMQDQARYQDVLEGRRPAPSVNLTGPNNKITGVETFDIPAKLQALRALDWNEKRQLFRDPTTGKLYDKDGNEVKK